MWMEIFTLICLGFCVCFCPLTHKFKCSLLHIAHEIQFLNKPITSNETFYPAMRQYSLHLPTHFFDWSFNDPWQCMKAARLLKYNMHHTSKCNKSMQQLSSDGAYPHPVLFSSFQSYISWYFVMILKVQAPDVHSGQYHAWVAFVPCIEFKPTQKVGSAWNQIKKSAEIETKLKVGLKWKQI